MGSLGVGRHTYSRWHELICPYCAPADGVICRLARDGVQYNHVREKFREKVVAAWRSALADLLSRADLDKDVYDTIRGELASEVKALHDAECRAREWELCLNPIAPLTEVALPADIHRTVVKMAESGDKLARGVAVAINTNGGTMLSEPFKEVKTVELEFSVADQRCLGRLPADKVLGYVLARTRFERAEQGFLAHVRWLLEQYKVLPPEKMQELLNWQLGEDPPPVLRVAEDLKRAA